MFAFLTTRIFSLARLYNYSIDGIDSHHLQSFSRMFSHASFKSRDCIKPRNVSNESREFVLPSENETPI